MSAPSRKQGFTLAELLVVIALIAILAALLFPVFKSVESSSRSAVCISNFRQVALATELYMADYEEKFMPVSDQPSGIANSRTDHTWVQIVLPYTKSFSIFHCPSDQTGIADVSTFDQDLVPGDTYSEFYTASQHVNTGYNYQYLSPILEENGVWRAEPRFQSDVRDPSRTLLFVDSKWSLADSSPNEGGSWLVVPPCRYTTGAGGEVVDTFLVGQPAQAAFVLNIGWQGLDGQQFGGAWPWHFGRMSVARVDGSAASLTPAALATGCNVTSNTIVNIADPQIYPWSSNF